MLEPVESQAPAFRALPRPGNFERRFHSAVENSPELVAGELNFLGRVDIEEVRDERVIRRDDGRFAKVPGLVVIRGPKADAGHDRKPAKVRVREGELVKGIEPQGVVVVRERAVRKTPVEIGQACIALIKNWPAEK